jgi:hypothetical protein
MGEMVIENDRPDVTGMGMSQAFGAVRPGTGQRGQMKHRGAAALAGWIRPDAVNLSGYQTRVSSEVKGNIDDGLDILGGKAEFTFRIPQLGHELGNMILQMMVEF